MSGKFVFLTLIAVLLFLAPVIVWGYLALMACAFATGGTPCALSPADFWEADFFMIAAVPWAIAAGLMALARRP